MSLNLYNWNTDKFQFVHVWYGINTKVDGLSANPSKWSDTLKHFAANCQRIVWVFEHFVGLAVKGLTNNSKMHLPLTLYLRKCYNLHENVTIYMFLLSLTRSKNFVEILKKTEHTSADRCFHKLQRLIFFWKSKWSSIENWFNLYICEFNFKSWNWI